MKVLLLLALAAVFVLCVEEPENVYLPDSPHNKFIQNGREVRVWPIIVSELNRLIDSVNKNQFKPEHFDNVIDDYNPNHGFGFTAIKSLLSSSDTYIKQLPNVAKLALQIPQVVTKRPILLLKKQNFKSVTLTQQEAATLLANAFFCGYPKRERPFTDFQSYPKPNFFRLFEGSYETNVEKLKCFFNYFDQMSQRQGPGSKLTYERRTLSAAERPNWRSSTKSLSTTVTSATGTIEENGVGMLQVDFANKFIGGGILGSGMTQEEVRFSINPELTAALLFTEELDDNEVLVMTGSEQFNSYTGYGETFRYAGSYKDNTPLDSRGRQTTQILAIDALRFDKNNNHIQYLQRYMDRELEKAYCGFMYRAAGAFKTPIATGKWGAGVFNGDPVYKFILQLLAASEAGRDMYMFTFGDEAQAQEMNYLYQYLKQKNTTVGKLYSVLEEYGKLAQQNGANIPSIGSFIQSNI